MNEFSEPAFGYLADNEWYGTEKVDGMNIKISIYPHISGDGCVIEIGGKTDAAHIPSHYHEYFRNVILKKLSLEVLQAAFPNFQYLTRRIVLYGEGYGAKIQKSGKRYLPNGGVGFALFDVKIEGCRANDRAKDLWWLERHNVEDIGKKLDLDVVPIVYRGSLWDAIQYVSQENITKITPFPAQMEGLVLQPTVPLCNRRGDRIITKFKVKDLTKMHPEWKVLQNG
jgi:hypothetical protein